MGINLDRAIRPVEWKSKYLPQIRAPLQSTLEAQQWNQPDLSKIEIVPAINDTFWAVMSEGTMRDIPHIDGYFKPSRIFTGQLWTLNYGNSWWLHWVGPELCIWCCEILVIE